MRFYLLCLVLLLNMVMTGAFQLHEASETKIQESLSAESAWVDAKFASLDLDKKIGQLFMVRAYSNKDSEHEEYISNLIKNYHLGGLCFFQGSPEGHLKLINKYQSISETPLLISMDAEWGLGMRLKELAMSFPKQMMLGALQDNSLLYMMGKEVAKQLLKIGVHINFAPVADVNNNSSNPVINMRSFGENRYLVSEKASMYMRGLQDGGVMACAKHFPGHGDTNTDSHYDLPIISHDMTRLDSIELFPFKVLSEMGAKSIMVAHLNIPAIEPSPKVPTTLSRKTVTDLLRNEINFKGLIFTDALDMKGVTKYYGDGEVEALALAAGNDVLLLPLDVAKALNKIKDWIKTGKIDMTQVDQSVKKILRAKYRLGLNKYRRATEYKLHESLFNPEAFVLKRRMIKNSITLVHNKDNFLPIKAIDKTFMASLNIGSTRISPFQLGLSRYANMEHFSVRQEAIPQKSRMLEVLKRYEVVFIALHNLNNKPADNFGITEPTLKFLNELNAHTKVVLILFGNPYALKFFDEYPYLIAAFDDDELVQDITSQTLFGGLRFKGRLPVTSSSMATYGMGLSSSDLLRFEYSIPQDAGMRSDTLQRIDELVAEAIANQALPGAQVLVAKDGKIVYHKAFGFHTYDQKQKVTLTDLYDVASITKIAATTLSIMKLHEDGLLSIFDPLEKYIPELTGSNKGSIIIEDLLAHHARLKPWIPFYKGTLQEEREIPILLPGIYEKEVKKTHLVKVTDQLYMRNEYVDTIWQEIIESNLRDKNNYRYSDLGFYLAVKLIRNVTGKPLDTYVQETFYKRLGLKTATYNPTNKFPLSRIAPTEKDDYFRNQVIHGHVHDFGAAMLGGVSGHAGLFCTSNDLAIIMQMLLNHGYYGGEQFLNYGTIKHFITRYSSSSRRGIGFDMKELNSEKSQNVSSSASEKAFGHLGFTGTAVWADPQHDLIYVFLSNRTYPSMHNNKLARENYRMRIQDVIYNSMQF